MSRNSIIAASLVSLCASISTTALQAQENKDIVPMKGDVKMETIKSGNGWTLSMLYPSDGSAPSEVYLVQGSRGIMESPLPDSEKSDLLDEMKTDRPATDDSTGSALESEGLFVVNKEMAEANAKASREARKAGTQALTNDECGAWNTGTYQILNLGASQNLSKTFSTSTTNFQGSVTVAVPVTAGLDANVTIRYKRSRASLGCIPYKVRFKSAQLNGDANVHPSVTVQGNFSVSDDFLWEKTVAEPSLGAATFSVGIVPVYIPFDLPVVARLSLTASASGSFTTRAEADVSGGFSVTCTDSDCDGTSYLTTDFIPPSAQNTTLSLNGRAFALPELSAAVRASFYAPSVFFGKVGPRAGADADFFGYAGNTCGDADGNGTNELVNGLTLDLDGVFSLRAEIGGLLGDKSWDFFEQQPKLAFYDLLAPAGGSSVLRPLIVGPSTVTRNQSNVYTVKMRPCYPYGTAQTTFKIQWGDGTNNVVTGAAFTGAPKAHTYTSAGTKTITATADFDNQGRDFDHSSTRNISVQ